MENKRSQYEIKPSNSSRKRSIVKDLKIKETPNIYRKRGIVWFQEKKHLFPIKKRLFSDDLEKEATEKIEVEEISTTDNVSCDVNNLLIDEATINYTTSELDILIKSLSQNIGDSDLHYPAMDVAFEVEITTSN